MKASAPATACGPVWDEKIAPRDIACAREVVLDFIVQGPCEVVAAERTADAVARSHGRANGG